MLALGWKPYQNDHEDANGQFEMNWEYDDALVTADRHAFFKYMVKSIAEKHGLRATFMPKPFLNLTGNGCHVACLAVDRTAKNAVRGRARANSASLQLGYHFLGGIIAHAEALSAITNPTVNTYKRINAPRDDLGRDLVAEHDHLYRQQPHPHGPHSRSRALRVAPRRRRGQSLSAAGRDPGRRSRRHQECQRPRQAARHQHVYRRPMVKGARKLPLNLLDALRAFERSALFKHAFGTEFVTAYVKLKMDNWNEYMRHLTKWEVETTLDC